MLGQLVLIDWVVVVVADPLCVISRERAIAEITRVVTIVAPHRLPRLDALLLKHHGEEERLLGMLKAKHAKELQAEGTIDSTGALEPETAAMPIPPAPEPHK